MVKRVQVVLSESIHKLGENGDLVEVAPDMLEIIYFLKN